MYFLTFWILVLERKLCLRLSGVPSAINKSSDKVVDKVKSLLTETQCAIPDVVIKEPIVLVMDIKMRKQMSPSEA